MPTLSELKILTHQGPRKLELNFLLPLSTEVLFASILIGRQGFRKQ